MTFVKGVSGNPKGRPKGDTPTADKIRQRLKQRPDPNSPTERERLIDDLLAMAHARDAVGLGAIKVMLERTEGKVPDRIAGPDGKPLTVEHQFDWEAYARVFFGTGNGAHAADADGALESLDSADADTAAGLLPDPAAS